MIGAQREGLFKRWELCEVGRRRAIITDFLDSCGDIYCQESFLKYIQQRLDLEGDAMKTGARFGQFFVKAMRLEAEAMEKFTSGQVVHFLCPENGLFANNENLEVCILKEVFPPGAVEMEEIIARCFAENSWPPAWRNGLYGMHHYHSTAHEALGVCSGWAEACFGGPGGMIKTAVAGDVIIIPAGVAHKCLQQSTDFRVVGAYPAGQHWNMKYGRPGDRPLVDKEIREVALPNNDPVYGKDGPLMKFWC